jgi:hypothetical protein
MSLDNNDTKRFDFITTTNNRINLDWDRIWSNRGHTLGEGMISPNKKHFYLNIPKNSSSFTKKCLESLNWTYANVSDFPEAKIIVCLRDPKERWISGIFEYLLMYHTNTLDSICEPFDYHYWPIAGEKLGISLLFDRLTFDDHTERQCVFLKDIDLERCVWLYVDKRFSINFSQLLIRLGYLNTFNTAPKENASGEVGGTLGFKKKQFKEFFNYIITHDENKIKNINQWFWCDYELIEQVDFYGTRQLNR